MGVEQRGGSRCSDVAQKHSGQPFRTREDLEKGIFAGLTSACGISKSPSFFQSQLDEGQIKADERQKLIHRLYKRGRGNGAPSECMDFGTHVTPFKQERVIGLPRVGLELNKDLELCRTSVVNHKGEMELGKNICLKNVVLPVFSAMTFTSSFKHSSLLGQGPLAGKKRGKEGKEPCNIQTCSLMV